MTFDETALQQPGGNSPAPVAYDPNEFWLRTLLRWYIGLIIRPALTIREIVEREPLLAGLLTTCVTATLWVGLLSSHRLLYLPISDFVRGVSILGPIAAGVIVIFSIAMAIAVHIAAQMARSPGDLDGTLASTLMANVVGLFTAGIGFILFLVNSFVITGQSFVSRSSAHEWLILLTLGWLILIVTIVVRKNYQTSWGRTAIITAGGLVMGVPVSMLLSAPLAAIFVFFSILLST